MANEYWEYDVKCRKCGHITRMYHSRFDQTSAKDFKGWAIEHSTFPVMKQCDCDAGMMMFHDLCSFGNIGSF